MPRPVCFMVMPFGTKDTLAQPPAPARVNFDALWEKAFRPAIEALGYQPVRADQDLGALIIKEMLERLYFADLVIADLTVANGNVYYEVGIRHAAKNGGCVLIGANWSKALFDVDQMREIRYPLPEGEIADATAMVVEAALKTSVPLLSGGTSPMFESLQGYPADVKTDHATAIRGYLDELSAFQTAARAVRLAAASDCRSQALRLQQQYAAAPQSPAVALEVLMVLRDCADWQDVLAYISRLPASLARLPIVQEQRCLAQSKTGDHRTAIAALEELVATAGATSERMGLIGGRYKKLAGEASEAAERRRFLSSAIASYERGMQLDLNDYYPSCNLPRLYRQRGLRGDDDRARIAAAVGMTACLRAKQLTPSDEWVRPTLIGMAFDAGDVATAEDLADQVERDGVTLWKLATTLKDLEVSIALHTNPDTQRGLRAVVDRLIAMR